MTTGTMHTVGRWLRDRSVVTPNRIALECGSVRHTYAGLQRAADGWASRLGVQGLRRGDRVAVLAGNGDHYVSLFFAAAQSGLHLVPLNWRLTPSELAYQLDNADPALLFADEGHADQAAAAVRVGRAAVPIALLEQSAAGTAQSQPAAGPPRGDLSSQVGDQDPLLLLYTSGTTGRPKGAVLTHANCFWTNLSLDGIADITPSDVVLQVLPQFHVGGWNVQPLLAWWKGATVIVETCFDPGRVLRMVAERRVTTMMGVPANYLFLAEEPGFATADLSSLRYVLVGGGPMPEPLLRRWQERGVSIIQGYGLTEAAPNVLCLPADDARRKVGWAGKPYPYVDVALSDLGTGELLEGTGCGELLVRGPGVFPGYWRDPAATAETMRSGWLYTGDVAERDAEGFYRIRDRVKDMYVSGGENVYPAEVEAALYEHPAVAEAAVVAVPDDRWGESGVAVVVLRPGRVMTADELLTHCRQRLAPFKVPRRVRFVDRLPRSAMNKVLKSRLRAAIGAGR